MTALLIRDEELSGRQRHEFSLDFLTEQITVRELIRSRVYQEVCDFNFQQNHQEFRGLVTPSDAEQALNGARLPKSKTIDWQGQFAKATAAYEQGQILILVNDHQTHSLDETIEVRTNTVVTFLKLTLLVGG